MINNKILSKIQVLNNVSYEKIICLLILMCTYDENNNNNVNFCVPKDIKKGSEMEVTNLFFIIQINIYLFEWNSLFLWCIPNKNYIFFNIAVTVNFCRFNNIGVEQLYVILEVDGILLQYFQRKMVFADFHQLRNTQAFYITKRKLKK